MTEKSKRRHEAERRSAWAQARGEILGGVDTFTSVVGQDPALRNQLRVIPRTVQRIDQALGF